MSSKYFLAPINTGFTSKSRPTTQLINFHRNRSGRGIGISYLGNVAVGRRYLTNSRTLVLEKPANCFHKIANAITREGSIPGIQLACNPPDAVMQRDWVNLTPQKYLRFVRQRIISYSPSYLKRLTSMFVASSIAAYKCGFQVIQIHAAHGYMLSQFLSKHTNLREDAYGYSDCYLIREILTQVRRVLPKVILDIRINLYDGIGTRSCEIKEKIPLIRNIVKLDADIISFSKGFYNLDKSLIYPQSSCERDIQQVADYAAKYPRRVWNIAGNVFSLNWNTTKYPPNLTFSFGRPLISNPYYIQHRLLGRKTYASRCLKCKDCHYYSFKRSHIICPSSMANLL